MKTKFHPEIILLGIMLLILTDCRKKTNPSSTENQISTPEYVNGEFLITKTYSIQKDSLMLAELTKSAIFTEGLSKDLNPSIETSFDVGNVFLNAVKFEKSGDASNIIYEDLSQVNTVLLPQKWQISGNGSFKGFTFENYSDCPDFKGFAKLPDSLIIGLDNAFIIEGYSGDFIRITINGGRNIKLIKEMKAPETKLILSKEEVQRLSGNGSEINLQIEFFKDTYHIVSGKIYRFRNHTQYIKFHVIIT